MKMEGTMEPVGERKKIHPHKFAMWVAMASITMMFAGLTSAWVVRQGQGNWRYYEIPNVFWYSTIVILMSSLTLSLGIRSFRQRLVRRYRTLMTLTLVLGLAFAGLQSLGFYQLYHTPQSVRMNGMTSVEQTAVTVAGNPSESFLFIIWGLHGAHILGGIIALLIVFLKAYHRNVKIYNSTGLEIVASYWHFVDVLWIYLFVFFLANQ